MMKKLISAVLSLTMLFCAAYAAGEAAEKISIGTLSVNGVFTLECAVPEGYAVSPIENTPQQVIALLSSNDPVAPVMMLSVAFDETYYDVDRMNDLDQEALDILEATFIQDDPSVEITYSETGLGTRLLVAKHDTENQDYVSFLSIYKGYFVEFVLIASREAADKNLTDAQIERAIEFLTELDFVPGEAADPSLVAGMKFITNLANYNAERNTVEAEVMHSVPVSAEIAEALVPGDTLAVGRTNIAVETAEKDEETGYIIVNGDLELRRYGDEYHVYADDSEILEPYVALILEVPENMLFEDGINADGEMLDEPERLTAAEFIERLQSGEPTGFNLENVWVTFGENGEILSVERFYTPWQ